MTPAFHPLHLILAAFPVLVWQQYFVQRHPDSSLLAPQAWSAFFFGGLSVLLVALIAGLIEPWMPVAYTSSAEALLRAFVSAGLIEETGKLLSLCLFLRIHWQAHAERPFYTDPLALLIFGASMSLGFAFLENIAYTLDSGGQTAILRAFTAVPCHGFLGAIMGYYVASAFAATSQPMRWLMYLKALLIPSLIHGCYDFPLMLSPEAVSMSPSSSNSFSAKPSPWPIDESSLNQQLVSPLDQAEWLLLSALFIVLFQGAWVVILMRKLRRGFAQENVFR